LLVAVRLMPAEVWDKSRKRAESDQARALPKSLAGAALVVLTWLASAAAVAALLW
jgi:hypothetical protein